MCIWCISIDTALPTLWMWESCTEACRAIRTWFLPIFQSVQKWPTNPAWQLLTPVWLSQKLLEKWRICGPPVTNRAGRPYWWSRCFGYPSFTSFISHLWNSPVITHFQNCKVSISFPIFLPSPKPGNSKAPVSHPSLGDHGTLQRPAAPWDLKVRLRTLKKQRFSRELPSKNGQQRAIS